MKRKTRSERKKEYRKERLERAVKNLEGRTLSKKKMSRANKITLLVILAVFFGMNFFSMRYKGKTFDFNKEEFKTNYEVFIRENEHKFLYDKNIKSIKKNKDEYSFLQESSQYTNSLIAIYESNNKVKRVAVIGILKSRLEFDKAYKENMVIISSIILGKDYDESEQFLRDKKLLDQEGNIIKEKSFLKVKYEDSMLTFSNDEKNVIFNIENE